MAVQQPRKRLDPSTPVAPYVGFRLTPDYLEEIDRRAAAAGVKRSVMIRQLIGQALAHGDAARAS